jgi:hypothetical protein
MPGMPALAQISRKTFAGGDLGANASASTAL